ncbi:hypothetical protein QOZ80_1BG0050580 [Eleusine coracana subsp. coracana]|nr:hypothetical protein QOZ80_1BG0050580 [Eleusine coracana subsp. coracana]
MSNEMHGQTTGCLPVDQSCLALSRLSHSRPHACCTATSYLAVLGIIFATPGSARPPSPRCPSSRTATTTCWSARYASTPWPTARCPGGYHGAVTCSTGVAWLTEHATCPVCRAEVIELANAGKSVEETADEGRPPRLDNGNRDLEAQ